MPKQPTVFAGNVFHRLTVVEETERLRAKERAYLCRCECGTLTTVSGSALRSGNTKSCGCLRRERVPHDFAVTHGHTRYGKVSPTYSTWKAMCDRCRQKNSRAWEWYGRRGIRVHQAWVGPGGFDQFLADMGEKPKNHSLDRIDPDGDYGPDNCRWATKEQQAQNKRPSARLSRILELEQLVEAQRQEIERLKAA